MLSNVPNYNVEALDNEHIYLKINDRIFIAHNAFWTRHATEGAWIETDIPDIGVVPVFDADTTTEHWQKLVESIPNKVDSSSGVPKLEDLYVGHHPCYDGYSHISIIVGRAMLNIKNSTFYCGINDGTWDTRVVDDTSHVVFLPDVDKSEYWKGIVDTLIDIRGAEWFDHAVFSGSAEEIIRDGKDRPWGTNTDMIADYIKSHYSDSWDVVGANDNVVSKTTPGKSPYASDGPLYKFYCVDHAGEAYTDAEVQQRAADQEALYIKLLNSVSDTIAATDAKMVLELSAKKIQQRIEANTLMDGFDQSEMFRDLRWAKRSVLMWIDQNMT